MKAYVVINHCIRNTSMNAYNMTPDHCVDTVFPFFFGNKERADLYCKTRVQDEDEYIRNYDYTLECELDGEDPCDIPLVGYIVTSVDYDVDDDMAVVARRSCYPKILPMYEYTCESATSYVLEEANQQAKQLGLGKNNVSPQIMLYAKNCMVTYIRDYQGRIVKAWFIHPVLPASKKLEDFDIH